MNTAFSKWLAMMLFIAAFLPVSGQTNAKVGDSLGISDTLKNGAGKSKNDEITKSDESNIKWKAEAVVKRFMRLLNSVGNRMYSIPETETIIRNSYANPVSKVFDDSTVIIADDLRQVQSNREVKEKPVFVYLKDFDLYYEKSESQSVAFSNFKVSNIKRAGNFYIKVYFDCLFQNKSTISALPYSLMSKVAELKLEKQDGKWNALIVDIHFLDSTDVNHPEKNDIKIIEDAGVATTDPLSLQTEENPIEKQALSKQLSDPVERERLLKQNDSIRTYMAFKNLKDSGDNAFNHKQFITAYQFYNEAEFMSSHSTVINQSARDYLETMVKQTRKNIAISDRSPDEQYTQYMQQSLRARNQRKYEEAVDFYNKALLIKPDDESTKAKKQELTTWINNLSRMDAKYTAGKYKDAIDDYDNAIKSDPKNSDYYLGRGKCFEKTKDLKKAMNDYKKAIELDENNLQAYFMKGMLHEKQGAFAEALACFTVCSTNDKTDLNSYLKMADINLAMNNINAAVGALDKGISNNPSAAILYNKKGELLYQQKKFADAMDNFSKAILSDSTSSASYYLRGLCELELKKISQAGEDFVKAKNLGLDAKANSHIQQMATDFYNDGLAKYNADKPDLALAVINYAVAIDPGKEQYRFQRAECYFKLRDFSNAIANYSQAIELNPDNFDAYKQRALSKFYLAQYKDAITDFETTIKLNSRSVESYKYLGDAYLKLKDYNKAITSYDAALSAPKSTKKSLDDIFFAELYNNMGEAYYYLDKLPLAMQNFKNAIENNKKNGEIYFNRGRTYLKLKELGNAEDDFKKALDFDGKNPLWNFKLGELYQVKEKYDKAIIQYNTAIGMDTAKALSLDPLYNRALCNVMLTNYGDALKGYTTILSKNAQANYPGFNTELGNLYLEVNQPDSALKYFDIAVTDASDPFPMYGKGVAYVQKKQLDEAFSWLAKSFALNKIPKTVVTRDKKLAAIRDDKRYKDLMRKYF